MTTQTLSTEQIVRKYYELANKNDWDTWSELFAIDTVMDEQLAGHIEGKDTLHQMMKGFPDMYASFRNVPQHFVIGADGETAAVVTHISATTHDGANIEARVCNYFRVEDGLITYMANFHDTAPFTAAKK
jgi:ketosteroid isomerase-like protein